MRWLMFGVLVLHAFVHLTGFVHAFSLVEVSGLTGSISSSMGVVWLLAGLVVLATAGSWIAAPRQAWWLGAVALVLSQVAIVSAWDDAKLGTLVNGLLFLGVVHRIAADGPPSFRTAYRRSVAEILARPIAPPRITEEDLAPLPETVAKHLRRAGVVGQPRVLRFQAEFRGRIRMGPDAPWMEFTSQQTNVLDPPTRLFLMDARRGGLPVDVYHAFEHEQATMRVRPLSLVQVVNASGPEMTQGETVTLLNDMCIMAPGSLVGPSIRWEAIDQRSARAHYRVGPHSVSAVLHFSEDGDLIDFVSDDRLAASPDGKEFTPQRWSTPLRDHRRFGPIRAPGRGEGRWHPPEGEFAYFETEIVDLRMNPG